MKIFQQTAVAASFVLLMSFLAPSLLFAAPSGAGSERFHEDAPVTFPKDTAEDTAAGAPADASAGQTGPTSEKKTDAIPETFPVGEHLSTKDQTSFVPSEKNKEGGITFVIVRAIDLLIRFIGGIALIVFIVGALLTVASEGKSDRLEKGKNAMVYAIIGLLIALLSFIIVKYVESILF